jgi:hypothetical protein
MAGFAPQALRLAREQSQFLRLRRILRNCGHDLHRCPPDSPDRAERGAFYATCDDGGIAVKLDLGEWLADLGKPSTPRWHVQVRLAMHSPEMQAFIRPVEGKPGYFRLTGDLPAAVAQGVA